MNAKLATSFALMKRKGGALSASIEVKRRCSLDAKLRCADNRKPALVYFIVRLMQDER